jgi:hypothetical protein
MPKRIPRKGDKPSLIWKHNSFLGHCAMARQNMIAIQMSETASPAAKKQAMEIETKLKLLAQELRAHRIDTKPVF